jgi:hypothetical protein
MTVAVIDVNGSLVDISGQGSRGGRIEITLVPPGGVVDDAGTKHVVAPRKTVYVDDNGGVNFSIVPNASITPSGSRYHVTYHMVDGSIRSSLWNIASTPSPQNIGDL